MRKKNTEIVNIRYIFYEYLLFYLSYNYGRIKKAKLVNFSFKFSVLNIGSILYEYLGVYRSYNKIRRFLGGF